jgi:hypothetical protein
MRDVNYGINYVVLCFIDVFDVKLDFERMFDLFDRLLLRMFLGIRMLYRFL